MKKIFAAIFVLLLLSLLAGCAPTLHDAIEKGDVEKVRALLKEGADVNARDQWKPALHEAAINGRSDIMRMLLDAGADINGRDYWGNTALQWAAFKGSIENVKLLLDKGANVNSADNHGKTPLVAAAEGNHANIIKFLISNGADVDTAVLTAEGLAARNPQSDWPATAKLLTKYASKQEVGRTASAVSIPNAESQPLSFIKADIDELPLIKAKPNKNAYAIVIGIEEYRQKLPKADFAVGDAKLMSEYLVKVMGYPEENVVTLVNDHAALGDFVKYFEKWLPNNVEKGSTVLVYYSGHGAPNPKTGDAYLVPYDGDPAFIAETGYSLKRLYDALGKLPAKEIVVALDSCFSGAGGRSVIAKGARPLVMNISGNLALSKNMTVMSASSGEQISSTYDEKGHGLFTYFLLKGIKDEDVIKPDGSLKMDDLMGYIKPQVERIARKKYNNTQTPQLIGAKKN